jgi:predicted transcriptional regulator of viral defense system
MGMRAITEKHQKVSAYLELMQSQGKYWITKPETIKALGITTSAFYNAVHRLMKSGKLIRVRNGFYTIVPPEYRNSKGLPPSHYIDALMKFLKQPYYIGVLSAAALHGASHQSPQELQVVTSKAAPLIEVGSSRIRFITKKDIESTLVQQLKTPTGYIKVSTPVATLFDLLRYVRVAGYLDNVTTVIVEMVENINSTDLVKSAKQERDISNIQRLGFLIDRFSENKVAARELHQMLKKKNPSYVFLRADRRKGVLEKDGKWNILVNTIVEPDL